MESLAGILAGARGNPYQQTSQGIAPLLTHYLMNRHLGQEQAQAAQGQLAPQPGQGPQLGQGMPLGLGMLSDNPQAAALIQALQAGQGSSQ